MSAKSPDRQPFKIESEQVRRMERERDKAKTEIGTLKAALRTAERERESLERELKFLSKADTKPPEWLIPPSKKDENHGTLVLAISDTHYGEVVNPREIHNLNAYNVKIAEKRTKWTGEGAIKIARDYFTGGGKLKIDGAVVMLGGDLVSGTIHEELRETNEQSTMESVVHFAPKLAEVVGMLYEEYKRVHVMAVPGNHDRFHKKVPAKRTATSAASWLFAKWIETMFQSYDDVTFDITEAEDAYRTIYNTGFCLTHGDQFQGGDGQVGPFGPVRRGVLKKRSRDSVAGLKNDVMVLGHFHQWHSAPGDGIIMNGAMKGYDEYAARKNYEPAPAEQSLWVVTPEYGVTFQAPVFCSKRSKEGW